MESPTILHFIAPYPKSVMVILAKHFPPFFNFSKNVQISPVTQTEATLSSERTINLLTRLVTAMHSILGSMENYMGDLLRFIDIAVHGLFWKLVLIWPKLKALLLYLVSNYWIIFMAGAGVVFLKAKRRNRGDENLQCSDQFNDAQIWDNHDQWMGLKNKKAKNACNIIRERSFEEQTERAGLFFWTTKRRDQNHQNVKLADELNNAQIWSNIDEMMTQKKKKKCVILESSFEQQEEDDIMI